MASGDSSDIFIKFRDQFGMPVPGESTTSVIGSRLFAGFGPGLMFEIDSFAFAVGIDDEPDPNSQNGSDMTNGTATGQQATGNVPGRTPGNVANHLLDSRGNRAPAFKPNFPAFRSGRSGVKYPVSVQPINIVRPIDKSSPSMLQKCIDTESFTSATVVKRKAAGSLAAGEPYLRMDFVGVLIRDVSWSNDEPIKETMRLISRAITVRYRPQASDGTFYDIQTGFWSMLPWETEAPLC